MTKPLKLSLLALLCSLLIACSLRPPAAEPSGYLLTATRPATAATGHGELVLMPLESARPFGDRMLVYRESDQRFVQDFYHVFLAPPTENIGQRMQGWLQQAGYTLARPGGEGTQSRRLLQARIDAMYVDVRQPKAPAAVLGLQIRLLQGSGDNKTLASWQLEIREPLSSADADPAVQGLDRALARALMQLEEKLGQTRLAN